MCLGFIHSFEALCFYIVAPRKEILEAGLNLLS